jgi:dienelactone hydrolase
LPLLTALVEQLGARATLKLFEDADHSFHVPARTGRKDSQIRMEMADAMAEWIATTIG